MAMQTFGNPTGTTTMDEIKQVGGDNVLEDPQEEGTGAVQQDDDGDGTTGDGEPIDGEEELATKPSKPATATPTGDPDTADTQRATIADELGYDLDNLTPKQVKVIEEVMATIAETSVDDTPSDTPDDSRLTELEREIKAERAKLTAPTTPTTTPPPPTRPAPSDDNADPIVMDPAQHYTVEAQLYSDSMDANLSAPQRRRAFEELREHRRYEFAKDFVHNMKSPVVLDWLREKLLADVTPKLAQFDHLNATAAHYRGRQAAERSAIVQLSKLEKTDPDIAEFVKPSKDGRPSAYVAVLKSDPRIAQRVSRLSENPEYADLPAERRAVLLEIDRIRLAHDLAPRSARSNAASSQSRTAKVAAATALVRKGATVSTAAAKAAASIIAKRSAGVANGGANASATSSQRRFANPDAERLRIAANKSTSIFS